jgi:outer membrane protein
MHLVLRSSLVVLIAAVISLEAAAGERDCEAPSPDCVEVGELDLSVALGAGTRTNPVHGNGDIPLVVIPRFSYYGRRFFIDNLEAGFTLFEGESNTVNLVTTPGYDRVFFYDSDPQNVVVPLVAGPDNPSARIPVPPRRTTFLAGPEWLFGSGRFSGQVTALYEFTGRHKGYELRAAAAVALLEGRSSLVASTGLTWKSTELVEYFYGITDLYDPGAALNPFVKLAWDVPLSDRWAFKVSAHYEYLDTEIADSPIISDTGVITAFMGFAYKVF